MIGLRELEVYNSIFNITKGKTSSNFIKFLMKKVVAFHTKKREMRLKETWIFQILQLPIYKMKYQAQLLSKKIESKLQKD